MIQLCRNQEFLNGYNSYTEGAQASVIIDGKAVTKYDDEETRDKHSDSTSVVIEYLEARSDAKFSVNLTVPQSYDITADALAFKLSLDGV